MSLLQNGPRQRKNSYVQGALSHSNSRKKLAWAVWKLSLGSNDTRCQLHAQRAVTPATVTGSTTKGRSQGLPKKKKKCQKEGRLVPGGTKIQILIMWYSNAQADKDLGKGREQRARSEAEEEGGRGLANRIEQPPRKRGMISMHGQQAWEMDKP